VKRIFSDQAWDDYLYWMDADPKILQRLNALIKECCRTPFDGTGKPEPLKGDLKGWWSRRITKEDRLVYRISGRGDEQAIEIAQCRFHYDA
jgi:toxin YoeB